MFASIGNFFGFGASTPVRDVNSHIKSQIEPNNIKFRTRGAKGGFSLTDVGADNLPDKVIDASVSRDVKNNRYKLWCLEQCEAGCHSELLKRLLIQNIWATHDEKKLTVIDAKLNTYEAVDGKDQELTIISFAPRTTSVITEGKTTITKNIWELVYACGPDTPDPHDGNGYDGLTVLLFWSTLLANTTVQYVCIRLDPANPSTPKWIKYCVNQLGFRSHNMNSNQLRTWLPENKFNLVSQLSITNLPIDPTKPDNSIILGLNLNKTTSITINDLVTAVQLVVPVTSPDTALVEAVDENETRLPATSTILPVLNPPLVTPDATIISSSLNDWSWIES